MWMTNYVREIKKQFRDKYHFTPCRTVGDEPCFESIPDGEYPMEINGKLDNVKIVKGKISCCNFAISAVCLCLLTGCMSDRFRGVFENKNVDLIEPELTIQSPWGMQVLKAKSLRTRVTNGVDWPLPPLTNSPVMPIPMHAPSSSGTITLPLELGVTVRSK